MRNLRLPQGTRSVTVFDQTYGGEDGTIRDVEDHVARAILDHDPRITEFKPGSADDPSRDVSGGPTDNRLRYIAQIGAMDRTEMFAAGRAMRVSLPANWTTERLRDTLARHAADCPEGDIPRTDWKPEGPLMMTPDHERDPNHGNADLGTKRGPQEAGSGATFSQASMAASHAEPLKPAPSGLGEVTRVGTTMPPLNQVDSNTGRPTGDSAATGLFDAAHDDHAHKAADAIEVAAADLDLALAQVEPARPSVRPAKVADKTETKA